MLSEKWFLLLGGASNVQGESCILEAKSAGYKVILVDTKSNIHGFKGSHLADIVHLIESYDEISEKDIVNCFPDIKRAYSFREQLQYKTSLVNSLIGCDWTAPNTIRTIQNKYKCREILRENGIAQPISILCETKGEIEKKLSSLGLSKAILKPVKGSGSKGVLQYHFDDYENTIDKIQSIDLPYLVEEFVEGDEYSIEMLICENNFHLLGITKKYLFTESFIEQGHVMPAHNFFSSIEQREIISTVEYACRVLGVTHGMIHVEFWYKSGKFILGEVHNRPGGDFISLMASKTSGVYIYKSQFCNKIYKHTDVVPYMAVWANKLDASKSIENDLDSSVYIAHLSSRNMACTNGKSFDEALINAKRIAKKL